MKKALLLVLALFALSLAVISGMKIAKTEQKIAIVDIPAVVAKSAQVQALKTEQRMKMMELEEWLKTVRADVEKQKTQKAKDKLLKEYNAEFAKKKEAIATEYRASLQVVDKSITETIKATAKAKGYNMVISKGLVVCGGDDITEDVQKVVK